MGIYPVRTQNAWRQRAAFIISKDREFVLDLPAPLRCNHPKLQRQRSQVDPGRSKGGFRTRIHLITNGRGPPMRAEMTAGQVSDHRGDDRVWDDDLPPPKVLIADRDHDPIRKDVMARGGTPEIPARRCRKAPEPVDDFIYALQNLVERCINKLENARLAATRYDATATS